MNRYTYRMVYEHLMTNNSYPQLVPKIFLKYCRKPHGLLSPHAFFFICIFYLKILQETPRASVSSRFFFLICIFYLKILQETPWASVSSRFSVICIMYFITVLGNLDRVSAPSRIAVDICDGTQWRGTELSCTCFLCKS